jgi:hypothetical protein
MPKKFTSEQAYVLGLLTSGGTIANGTFTIVMPFDKWGADPSTAAAISRDLLTKIRSLFSTAYKVDINYSLGNKNRWVLSPIGNPNIQEILDDLGLLGLPFTGQLLNTADLVLAKQQLRGMRAEHFITGIFDARASLTESHRRFNDDSPVVSIEIPGSTMNFKFVVQLCAWLTDLGSVTDQILFNHPCQHATSDPTYSGWKKGFKIRFLAKSFLAKHSFAIKAKATDAITLASRQQSDEQSACNVRHISANTAAIHDDIKSTDLPTEVRGKLFLHYHHICAAMGCPHAPMSEVQRIMSQASTHVSVYPRLSKGGFSEMRKVHSTLAAASFPASAIIKSSLACENIIRNHLSDYNDLNVALAYLLSDQLNGKRHVGSMKPILEGKALVVLEVREISDVDKAPLFIGNRSLDRGVVVSCPTGFANAAALKSKVKISGIEIRVI